MSIGPTVQLIESWPAGGSVYLLGDDAIKAWSDVGVKGQQQILKRAEMASMEGIRLNETKIRWLQGKSVKGTLELKVGSSPPLRAIGVRDGRDWYFSYVGTKPKEHQVVPLGEKAIRLYDELVLSRMSSKSARDQTNDQAR